MTIQHRVNGKVVSIDGVQAGGGITRARQFINEQRIADLMKADDPNTEAGKLSALLKAAENAKAELDAKREELTKSGYYTNAGILEALKPEAKRLAAHLNELHDRIWKPAVAKIHEDEAKLKPPPTLEPTADDERLAQRFAALPKDKRSAYLTRAMTGQDDRLAKALATAHPLITDLTEGTRSELRDKFVKDHRTEERQAIADRFENADYVAEEIGKTVLALGEAVGE